MVGMVRGQVGIAGYVFMNNSLRYHISTCPVVYLAIAKNGLRD